MTENISISIDSEERKHNKVAVPADGRFESYLEYLDSNEGFRESEVATIRHEISSVLEKCTFEDDAGLVVGYIQSGKTTSFIGLMALAADNDIPLYIVLGGVGNILVQQNFSEIKTKLEAAGAWDIKLLSTTLTVEGVVNPRNPGLSDDLIRWSKSYQQYPDRARPIVLVVQKEDDNIQNLINIVKQSPIVFNRLKTMIIDDEVDQHGLNSKVRSEEEDTSKINALINELRDCIKNHQYIGVTATPHALFLLQLEDMMSPSFCDLITPGEDYVGGLDLFGKDEEYIEKKSHLKLVDPFHVDDEPVAPPDLKSALLLFFIGATHIEIKKISNNVSMLIHPSMQTIGHKQFKNWCDNYRTQWLGALAIGEGPTYEALIDNLKEQYNDLKQTQKDLIDWDDLLKEIEATMALTNIAMLNRTLGGARAVNWNSSSHQIICAGVMAERGMVVRGLTVTYMPRDQGAYTGRMDTVQQRARFFGYKKEIKGLIRVFVTENIGRYYINYVGAEEIMRQQIMEFNRGDQPFQNFSREFFKIKKMTLTRPQVYLPGERREKSGWIWMRYADTKHQDHNKRVIENFVNMNDFSHDNPGHPERTPDETHKMITVSLERANDDLLSELIFRKAEDSQRTNTMFAFIRYIAWLNQNGDDDINPEADVYLMAAETTRTRGIDTGTKAIKNLMRGAAMGQPERYGGDRSLKDSDKVSIQLHKIDLTQKNERGETERIAEGIWSIAVNIPDKIFKKYDLVRPHNFKDLFEDSDEEYPEDGD